jgi:hypothetical protein
VDEPKTEVGSLCQRSQAKILVRSHVGFSGFNPNLEDILKEQEITVDV